MAVIDLRKLDEKTKERIFKYLQKHPEWFEITDDGELYLKPLDDKDMAKLIGVKLWVIKSIGGLNPWELEYFDLEFLRWISKNVRRNKV